jgi:uncharacterized protein YabN with tetrapyrrole methylase and pyrophosphatase domain
MSNKPKQEALVNPFQRLGEIVTRLRSKEGCPWDQRQDALSLKKYLLEEAQELVEAIEQGNPQAVCEEAGDLYFVLALLMEIYAEQQVFSVEDPLHSACAKMLRRHPQIFAPHTAPTGLSEEQLRRQWQDIKAQEQRSKVKKSTE